VFEAGNPAMSIVVPHSPHRVFISRLGRIPPPHGRSPEGPHTHVLPKLLQHGRTHAATEQIPDGFVPCAHLYPAHPTKDALERILPFDAARHVSFQEMLPRFGNKGAVDLKRRIMDAIVRGEEPSTVAVDNDRVCPRQCSNRLASIDGSGWIVADANGLASDSRSLACKPYRN
jgi:hypothetical protein